MLPDQPSGVFAVGTRLSPETRCISSVINRQVFFFQYLVPVYVCHRDFSGRNKIQLRVCHPEEFGLEFRELSCSGHAFFVHQDRGENLCITF